MLKLHSCLIVKNEETNMPKLIKQLLEFSDEIHITDTGSTDETVNIIKNFQKENKNIFLHHFDWIKDFSAARNFSLNYKNDTSDFKFWCDADDLLTPELIKRFKDFKQLDVDKTDDCYMLEYQYAALKDPSFFQYRVSIIKTKSGFKWHDPIHEYLCIGENGWNYKENYDFFSRKNNQYLVHQRIHTHTDRNLDIFMNLSKTPEKMTSRNYYYFGVELYNSGYYELSIPILLQCVYFDDNNYVDKINASIYLVDIYGKVSDKYIVKKEHPIKDVLLYLYEHQYHRADLLYNLGNCYYNDNKKIVAEQFYLMAKENIDPIPQITFMYDKQTTLTNTLLQLSMIEYYTKNNPQKALEYNKEILKIIPNHKTAKSNIAILNKELGIK